jgi:SNF2 family DNA or RNA helicase
VVLTFQVVIYVQFRLLARIVGRICEKEGWGFLYLTGDASLEHRSKVVKNFRENPNIKILVAGLKCGGIGLNFPWANRCISLDLWVSFPDIRFPFSLTLFYVLAPES